MRLLIRTYIININEVLRLTVGQHSDAKNQDFFSGRHNWSSPNLSVMLDIRKHYSMLNSLSSYSASWDISSDFPSNDLYACGIKKTTWLKNVLSAKNQFVYSHKKCSKYRHFALTQGFESLSMYTQIYGLVNRFIDSWISTPVSILFNCIEFTYSISRVLSKLPWACKTSCGKVTEERSMN